MRSFSAWTLEAGKGTNDSFTNEKIPTLSQVLDELSRKNRYIDRVKRAELYPGNLKKSSFRNQQKTSDHVIVQSFNVSSMKKMQ